MKTLFLIVVICSLYSCADYSEDNVEFIITYQDGSIDTMSVTQNRIIPYMKEGCLYTRFHNQTIDRPISCGVRSYMAVTEDDLN